MEVLQLRRARERRNQALEQESAKPCLNWAQWMCFTKRIALEFETESEKARLERMTVKFKQVMVEVSESDQATNKVEE